FALAGKRMRGERDDWDIAGLWIVLDPSRGFPAIDHGHFEDHQDDIGALADRHSEALLAILGGEHLEIAKKLELHLEYKDVVRIKHLGHDAASISLPTGALLCTSRRMRSTSSAG